MRWNPSRNRRHILLIFKQMLPNITWMEICETTFDLLNSTSSVRWYSFWLAALEYAWPTTENRSCLCEDSRSKIADSASSEYAPSEGACDRQHLPVGGCPHCCCLVYRNDEFVLFLKMFQHTSNVPMVFTLVPLERGMFSLSLSSIILFTTTPGLYLGKISQFHRKTPCLSRPSLYLSSHFKTWTVQSINVSN